MNNLLLPIDSKALNDFANQEFITSSNEPEEHLISPPKWNNDVKGIFHDNKLVGYIELNNNGLINILYIIPQARKMGIGKSIIEIIKKDQTILFAHPFTQEAEYFFISCGFTIDETFDPKDTNTVVWIN